jgi:hypothetical protein
MSETPVTTADASRLRKFAPTLEAAGPRLARARKLMYFVTDIELLREGADEIDSVIREAPASIAHPPH